MNIKNQLKEMKLSQQEVSDYLGISRNTLRKKMNDPKTFTVEQANELKKIGVKI